MYTIYVAQHPRKPMHILVHIHQSLAVFGGRLPKIPIPEYVNDAPTKILQTLASSCLDDVEVLVEHVSRASVGQRPGCGSAFMYRRVLGTLSLMPARLFSLFKAGASS